MPPPGVVSFVLDVPVGDVIECEAMEIRPHPKYPNVYEIVVYE